ncbi:MAG TPA: D-2-hydroxyacid dehydrogenase [Pirellulaceae bacterium]|jgi:D-3-phosphoglycerate dehydrogenase|nr:D-2-hydroxyacid dehydrogenase [Pirellulaceae bacterium]
MRVVLCYQAEERHCRRIRETFPDVEVVNAGQEGVAQELFDADVFFGHAKVPVDWEGVVAKGRLRWIQSSAAGLDHCLVPSVIDSEIPVASASGLFADQVAEQTLALALGLIRSMPVFFRAQQAREYVRRPTFDLHGKTVAILGFGGNGRRLAEVLQPFRVRILATDYYPVEKPDYVEALLPVERTDEALFDADLAIVTLPLYDRTLKFVDAGRFAAMKPGAFFVNVARGQVVDEAALIEALASGKLAGAGIDVAEVEPLPPESPLWEMPNVLITPHVGAQSARRIDDATDLFLYNFERFQRGDPILNLVDKQLGFPHPSVRYRKETHRLRDYET